MRKLLSVLFSIVLALMVVSCSPAATDEPVSQDEPNTEAGNAGETTDTTDEPEADTEASAEEEESSSETSASDSSTEPIRIGLNKPLSGPVGFLGQDEKLGFEIALEEINGSGGVLGRPLELFYGDNECDPTKGVNAHRELIDLHDVVVTIGGSCSSATLGFMPILEEAQIPNLTISATNPDITRNAGVGGNIWEFRLNVDDSIMAEHFSKFIANDASNVVMIAANNDWGRGAVAAYEPNFAQLGVEFLGAEYFEQGQADYRPILTKIRAQNPESLLLIMESRDAATLVRQIKEMGWDPRPQIFARGSVVTPEFAEAIEDDCSLGDGIMEATINASGVYPEFDQTFEEIHGHGPPLSAGLGYAGLYTVAEAIKLAGSDDPAAIREAFTQLDYENPIMGRVQFDDHNQNHPNMFVTTMNNCEIELLEAVPTRGE